MVIALTVALLVGGVVGFARPASAETAEGVDVASWQHPAGAAVNWPAVAASGMRFGFVKATESTTYVNPYFASDRSSAIASGMGVGAYHFANPAVDPIAQAQYFIANTGSAFGYGLLPPVLDLEQTGGLSPAAVTAWALAFLQYVQ